MIKNFAEWKDEVEGIWINPDNYHKEYSELFEMIGNIKVEKEYKTTEDTFRFYSAAWNHPKESADMQFESEKKKAKPTKTLMVTQLITRWRGFVIRDPLARICNPCQFRQRM